MTSERVKITVHVVDGVRMTCFKDPSVSGGEWVVNSPNFTKRFKVWRWTRKCALKDVLMLEQYRADLQAIKAAKHRADMGRLDYKRQAEEEKTTDDQL